MPPAEGRACGEPVRQQPGSRGCCPPSCPFPRVAALLLARPLAAQRAGNGTQSRSRVPLTHGEPLRLPDLELEALAHENRSVVDAGHLSKLVRQHDSAVAIDLHHAALAIE